MSLYEHAPDLELLDSNGRAVRLSDYWRDGLTAFTFIRYLGCLYCRDQVKDMRNHAPEIDRAGLRVVLIAPARPDAAAAFVEQFSLPFPLLCDPRREAYRAYGLTDGTVGQLINPRIVVRGATTLLRGTMHGKPETRVSRQLPGTAIVDTDGTLRLMHVARDAVDHLNTRQLLEAVERVRRQDPAPTARIP
jgi:peroxiredoxin